MQKEIIVNLSSLKACECGKDVCECKKTKKWKANEIILKAPVPECKWLEEM
jgi:hypothetical protein